MRSGFLALALASASLLSACATVPRDRGGGEINRMLTERGAPAVSWTASSSETVPTRPLTLSDTVRLAFVRSPAIQAEYAELGLAAADLREAVELPDLTLGYSKLSGGGESQVTRSLSLAFSELLMRRSRVALADASFAMTRNRVAARLLELESQVSSAWLEYVAARQIADLAAVSAQTARASADYAQRLRDAGNLPARALAQELAAASSADIAAARARADAAQSRAALAALVGLSVRDAWQVPARLPALPHHDELPANLPERAFAARPDLAAAQRETEAFAMVLRAARAWRWLGDFEVGYEEEKDSGVRLTGPSLHLTLPLFHWNRAGVLRAQSALEGARARRAALELELRNQLALQQDQLATRRQVAEAYRDALLPQREIAFARTMEEVNYMLAGAFEALATRREQFAAYQEYIAATRDYWQTWLELRRISGGALALPALDTASLENPLNLEAAPAPAAPAHGAH